MIDKKMSDKPVQFEISMGNAGNSIDGQMQSAPKGPQDPSSPSKHDDEASTAGYEEPGLCT